MKNFFSSWIFFSVVVAFIVVCLTVGPVEAAEVAEPTVTLQHSVVEIIKGATEGVKAGVDFLKQEIPDVVRQLIVFNLVYSAVLVSIGVLMLIIIPIYWVIFLRKYKDEAYYPDAGLAVGIPSSVVLLIAGSVCIGNNLGTLLKLWLAPKVWLIEYAASLVK